MVIDYIAGMTDAFAEKIYNELVDDWGIENYIDEEVAKMKIRELGLDRDKITNWVETDVVGGNY